MGSCTQKGIATPYSQLLIFTAVVVFSRISCLEITGVMRPPLNLSFLLLHMVEWLEQLGYGAESRGIA